MARRINGEELSMAVKDSDKLLIVDFYSDTCVPCKQISPILSEVEEEYGSKVEVVKINVAYDMDTATANGVQSVPTLLFFKEGKELDRLRGVSPKKSIEEMIEKFL